MFQCRKRPQSFGVSPRGFDPNRALSRRGQAHFVRQHLADVRAQAQAVEARLGQHDRVVISALQLLDARIHVSAKFEHLQIVPLVKQLRLAAQAARADARALRQGLPAWRRSKKAARRARLPSCQWRRSSSLPGNSVGTSFML